MNRTRTMISEDRQRLVVHLMDKGASLAFMQGRGDGMTLGDLADVFFDEENCLSGRLPKSPAVHALLRDALMDAGCELEPMQGGKWSLVWQGTQMVGRVSSDRYVLKLSCVSEDVAAVLSLGDVCGSAGGK